MSKKKLLMKCFLFVFICTLAFSISTVFAAACPERPGGGDHASDGSGTCTTNAKCTYCSQPIEGPPTDHNYSTAATCTSPAKCSCGATTGSALGHNMGSWYTDVAATCMREGQSKRDCSRCNYYETDVLPIDPNAHNWVWKNDGNGEPSNYSRTTQ